MKYFLCAFDTIYLGLPSERTERIISVSKIQSSVYETDEQNTFISLPLLFRYSVLPAPHGIVLKSEEEEKKIILLVPPLDIDLEIPEKDIYSVPKAFSGILHFIKGVCFINRDQEDRLIFILDIEKLIKDYKCKTR